MKRITTYFFAMILLVYAEAGPDTSFSWRTYTSLYVINGFTESDDVIWAATDGGLIALDPQSNEMSIRTNTEGLVENRINCVVSDETGSLWIGSEAGFIQSYDPASGVWRLIDDFAGHPVTKMVLHGDSLFVGLDIGISLYRISKAEVNETYRHLGSVFEVEIPVQDIAIFRNTIWAATEDGIASAQLSNVNLLDPESWENYTAVDGLPDNRVNALVEFDGMLYAGTAGGSSRLVPPRWEALDNKSVQSLAVHGSSLFQLADDGVYERTADSWVRRGGGFTGGIILESLKSTLWCGTDLGIMSYDADSDLWNRILPDSPASDVISALTPDGSAGFWAASRDRGFFHFDGSMWINYSRENLPVKSNDFVAAATDIQNTKWFGSWGGGLTAIDDFGDVALYDASDGSLSGITADPDYVVVIDISADIAGNIWILNREALNNNPLAVFSPDGSKSYFGVSSGLTTNFVRVLEIDATGKKWIGTDNHGIFVLDDSGTPHIRDDDSDIFHITTADGLSTNAITALAADFEGGMWIGTALGLFYYGSGNLDRRYGLPSDNITALAVDGAGNVWAGMEVGVSYYSNATFEWTHFTSENSPLVHSEISAIAADLQSGKLLLGTNEGISTVTTPFSLPTNDIEPLNIYPNPFKPAEHNNVVIDNLSQNVSVAIFHSSGYLVREFPESEVFGRQLIWDGLNGQGKPCTSGIYLIISVSQSGEYTSAKAALIR